MLGSISFLIAEIIGVVTIGILADQYGRKLMLLMCLYIPVVCVYSLSPH
jgi:MFS family permease